jgi:UDP-N-acetylglucosamine acyltransferase
MIHPTAIINPESEIAEGVDVGPYTVIEKGVLIDQGTKIGPHVVIREGTRIGKECQIFQFASIGEAPQALAYKGEKTSMIVGDRNVIREFVTLHRGTVHGGGKTTIGNDNLLMAYAHVAHDCEVGNHVILANGATLAGHILIEDHANISGLSAVHQFCQIGTHAFVSGLTGVTLDIPPYMLASGDRAKLFGLNLVGLKRNNFSEETIKALKKSFRIIFRSGITLEKAMKLIEEDKTLACPEVQHLLQFIKRSKRGISR